MLVDVDQLLIIAVQRQQLLAQLQGLLPEVRCSGVEHFFLQRINLHFQIFMNIRILN